jgi:hypothetical protein
MKTIFKLIRYDIDRKEDGNGVIIPPSYPEFDVEKCSLGFYTFLEQSEVAMKRDIEDCKTLNIQVYCYHVYEYYIDCYENKHRNIYSRRSYLPNGDMFDANMTPDGDNKPPRFYGRIPEQIRFKTCDIVELLCDDYIVLCIVFGIPYTVDEVQRFKNNSSIFLDGSDDCYMVISPEKSCYEKENDESFYSSDEFRESIIHSHPLCINVFAPRLHVTEKMREILLRTYHNYC